MGTTGMLPLVGALIGFRSSLIGFILHIAISALIGLLFAFLLQGHIPTILDSLGIGAVYGFFWWILGGLTLMPLLLGVGVSWTAYDAGSALPSLIGHLTYGAGMGISYPFLEAWLRRSGIIKLEEPKAISKSHPLRHIVILGGGFAGVNAAQHLERLLAHDDSVTITLVSNTNYLLFTPMLAEVSSSSIEARHITSPLRAFFRKVRFINAEVKGINANKRLVQISHCSTCEIVEISYDHLVIALGSVNNFYDIRGVEKFAFTLKTLGDAVTLRNHVLNILEHADLEPDSVKRGELLTFVVVGGGFAGTELIAELYDFAMDAARYYRHLPLRDFHFTLIEGGDRIIPEISSNLADYAMSKLRQRGIAIILKTRVTAAENNMVYLSDGQKLSTRTLIWTAGVAPNPVVRSLPFPTDPRKRLIVDGYLRVKGENAIWAIGDCAMVTDSDTGLPCPPTAQHALREGSDAAHNIAAALYGTHLHVFKFKGLGMLVALGRRTAVAEIFSVKFSGFLAWMIWRITYLSKLPGLERKIRVSLDWTLDLFFPRDIVQTLSQEREDLTAQLILARK